MNTFSNQTQNQKKKQTFDIEFYKTGFKEDYKNMKDEIGNININLNTYKSELSKMSGFLEAISIHEDNYKKISSKLVTLESMLEETEEVESQLIQLTTNQQIINVTEYVKIYEKITKIINYFSKSKFTEKEDYINNLINLMKKGFKVFESSFYNILKRYSNINKEENENEKNNLLNKLKTLAECLSDPKFDYHFTGRLITQRSDYIISQLTQKRIALSKKTSYDADVELPQTSILSQLFSELSLLIEREQEYIFTILESCQPKLQVSVYKLIISKPLEYVITYLKELPKKELSLNNLFNLIDFDNSWIEKYKESMKNCVMSLEISELSNNNNNTTNNNTNNNTINNTSIYSLLEAEVSEIESVIKLYIKSFLTQINTLNERLENENVLPITNKTITFFNKIIKFPYFLKSVDIKDFNTYSVVNKFILLLEQKSVSFEKNYSPLRWLFLINNVFFIYSKIKNKQEFLDSYNSFNINNDNSLEKILSKIEGNYINGYNEACWKKVIEEFNSVKYEFKESNVLKNSSKENAKKAFVLFNETMSTHLKIQKQLKIIDSQRENSLIESSINYISNEYDKFLSGYLKQPESSLSEKFIKYENSSEIKNDIKMFFSSGIFK